jgi:hypothetical protein
MAEVNVGARPVDIEMTGAGKSNYTVVPSGHESDAGTIPSNDGKGAADLTWTSLNFKVKDKAILTNCWGKVNKHLLSSYV